MFRVFSGDPLEIIVCRNQDVFAEFNFRETNHERARGTVTYQVGDSERREYFFGPVLYCPWPGLWSCDFMRSRLGMKKRQIRECLERASDRDRLMVWTMYLGAARVASDWVPPRDRRVAVSDQLIKYKYVLRWMKKALRPLQQGLFDGMRGQFLLSLAKLYARWGNRDRLLRVWGEKECVHHNVARISAADCVASALVVNDLKWDGTKIPLCVQLRLSASLMAKIACSNSHRLLKAPDVRCWVAAPEYRIHTGVQDGWDDGCDATYLYKVQMREWATVRQIVREALLEEDPDVQFGPSNQRAGCENWGFGENVVGE